MDKKLQTIVDKIEGKPSLFEEFYNKTKITSLSRKEGKKVPRSWVDINFKGYPRFPRFFLPRLKKISSLEKIIKQRSSQREFTGLPVDKNILSQLLLYSSGIVSYGQNWNESKRAYPSAGARYPLELYIILPDTNGIPAGIYHYNVKQHSLEELLRGNYLKKMADLTGQDWVKKAGAILLISAVFKRTAIKYQNRAPRHIFLEAGHLAQNLYLLATDYNLSCCAIGGWNDDKINNLLDLPAESEVIVYILAIGRYDKLVS